MGLDLPTFSVRGKWFSAPYRDAWQAVGLFGAPSPIPPLAQRWCGEPAYRLPITTHPTHVSLTSCRFRPPPRPVALHVALPPHLPATMFCHPGGHLSSHVTSVPGPRDDVMLTSSVEKCQIHTFSKFNVINDQMSRFRSFSRAKEGAVVNQLPQNLSPAIKFDISTATSPEFDGIKPPQLGPHASRLVFPGNLPVFPTLPMHSNSL